MTTRFRIFHPEATGLGAFSAAMDAAKQQGGTVRVPHHSCSVRSMLGGLALAYDPELELEVVRVQLGEVSLAGAHGVLVMDELPEWKREVVEAVARVFHAGHVRLVLLGHRGGTAAGEKLVGSWAKRHIELPASFHVYATARRCPCGLSSNLCRCRPDAIKRFNDRAYSFRELFETPVSSGDAK